MGGRGAASGISDKGRKYWTEYHSVLVKDNIKFVKYNFENTTVPLETMSADKRRIYCIFELLWFGQQNVILYNLWK